MLFLNASEACTFFLGDILSTWGQRPPPASVWELPNFWNTGFSGFLVLALPVMARLLLFKPKLILSFDSESGDAVFPVWRESKAEPNYRIQAWYRLRVRNGGLVPLINPRIWCLAMTSDSGPLVGAFPFTPFEMNWAESDRDFQIGSLAPGKFRYRLDLGYVDVARTDKNTGKIKLSSRSHFVVHRRNQEETIRLLSGLDYYLCLMISNDNLLVPAHFVQVKVRWNPAGPATPDEPLPTPSVAIHIERQGPLWWARLRGRLKRFEY